MKYKRTLILTLITIIIVISMICALFIIRNSIDKYRIKKQIELSEEEKSNLNYEQLIEDIKSLENGHGIKYAKKKYTT